MAGVPVSACPHCGAEIHESDAFCEACGGDLVGAVEPAAALAPAGDPDVHHAPFTAGTSILNAPQQQRTAACGYCGGAINIDGFCENCGAKAPTRRDHWTESPAAWVGAVCDRGIRHARNEDALATMATESLAGNGFAVLVVCDGVTSAPDSDQASLAAAIEARDHLMAAVRVSEQSPIPVGAAAIEASVRWMTAACRVAQVAVIGVTERIRAAAAQRGPVTGSVEPPSCTFVAAVVQPHRLITAWCGDSRAYWLPDDGEAVQLSTDHSLASELIAQGMTRELAEQSPTAHTITRWLGIDSPTPQPDTATTDLDRPGWVLLCSDGMWNYATGAVELAGLVSQAIADGATSPTTIAESLAAFANDQGGHDNITVALARVEGTSSTPPEEA